MATLLDKPAEDQLTYVSFPIEKFERTDDGDLIVYGKATDGSVDSDEQIVDMGWSRKAMEDWFSTGANVRMSHDPRRPVGKGIQIELSDDGHFVKSLVVDRDAQRLVEKGVLRAYSVGISRPVIDRDITGKARGGVIKGGELAEISLVDRPANRNCGFTLVKSSDSGTPEWVGKMYGSDEFLGKALAPSPSDVAMIVKRRQDSGAQAHTYSDPIAQRLAEALAAEMEPAHEFVGKRVTESGRVVDSGGRDVSDLPASDFAGPGKTFPIKTPDDVSDAASLAHHAKNPSAVRSRIRAIARRKFPGKKLPPSLGGDGRKSAGLDGPFGPDEGINVASVQKALSDGSLPADLAVTFLAYSGKGAYDDPMDAQVMAHMEHAHDALHEAMKDQAMDEDEQDKAGKKKSAGDTLAKGGVGDRGSDENDEGDHDDDDDAGMPDAAVGTRAKAKKGKKNGKKMPFGGKQAPPFGKKDDDGDGDADDDGGKDDDDADDKGKGMDAEAIKAEIARLQAELAKCGSPTEVVSVQNAQPAKRTPTPRGGGMIGGNESPMVGEEPDWMRLGKAMERTTDAPYSVQRAHDALCAAYDPALVKAAYPSLAHPGEAVDAGELKEAAMMAVAAGDLETGEQLLAAAKAAAFLADADPAAITDAAAGLHKSFTDMYPSVRLSPGQIMPQQFQRPYVSEGHARTPGPSGDTSAGTVPSYHPTAADFRRGPLAAGHAAPSPGNKGDSNPYPAGTPAGAIYAHAVMAQQASAAMRTVHDTYAARWNGVCPMSMNAGPVTPGGLPAGAAVKGKKKKKKGKKMPAEFGAMDPVPAMPATPVQMKAAGAADVSTGVDITIMLSQIERRLKKLATRDEQVQEIVKSYESRIESQAVEMETLRRDVERLGSQPAAGGPPVSAMVAKAATVMPAERRSLVDEAGAEYRAEKLAFLQSLAMSGNPGDREAANAQITKMLTS